MTYRTVTSFVIDCDVCLQPLEAGDGVALFATTAEADEQANAADWQGGVCPQQDVPHQLARTGRTAAEKGLLR